MKVNLGKIFQVLYSIDIAAITKRYENRNLVFFLFFSFMCVNNFGIPMTVKKLVC